MDDRGATLAELLVVIAITAVLATVAIPGFTAQLFASRLSGATNELVAAFNLARSEAIKRKSRAVVCTSSDGHLCTDGGWQQGWIVFHDINNNAERDAGEDVMNVRSALPKGISIEGNTWVSRYVSYAPTGGTLLISGAWQAGTFTLCGEGGSSAAAREIVIASTGRVRVVTLESCPSG